MTWAMRMALLTGSSLASAMGITFSPEDRTGGGAPGSEGGDPHSGIPKFGQEDFGGDGEGEDDGESDDLSDMLSAFASDDSDDEDDSGGEGDEEDDDDLEEASTRLNKELSAMITNYRIPDNAIPDDFDPNDRKQLADLLNNTSRSAITHAMAVTIRPVQAAMQRMETALVKQMDLKLASTTSNLKDSSVFNDIVPEAEMPKYRLLVEGLDKQLKEGKKSMTVRERADAVRRVLNRMGIKEGAKKQNQRRNGGSESGIRTGKAALDSLFGPLPGK